MTTPARIRRYAEEDSTPFCESLICDANKTEAVGVVEIDPGTDPSFFMGINLCTECAKKLAKDLSDFMATFDSQEIHHYGDHPAQE